MSKCRYDLSEDCHNKDCLACVLDKIRAELHATAEMHEDGDYYLREEWIDEIINKYKAEVESQESGEQASDIKVGDEVMTKHAERGIAVRDTYYIGEDRESFTLIWFGTHMSSCKANDLTRTGKHYPQIAEIMAELRDAESEK